MSRINIYIDKIKYYNDIMLRNNIFVPLFDAVPTQLGKLSNLFLKYDDFV